MSKNDDSDCRWCGSTHGDTHSPNCGRPQQAVPMDCLTQGQRADAIADLARQQSCTIALLKAEVERLTKIVERERDSASHLQKALHVSGRVADAHKDRAEIAESRIAGLLRERNAATAALELRVEEWHGALDKLQASRLHVITLQRERDGVTANFEHDGDCARIGGGTCNCWLWLRVRMNEAEAKLAHIQKLRDSTATALAKAPSPERLDEMSDEIHRMARWGLSSFNLEMRIAMAAELRAFAAALRERGK